MMTSRNPVVEFPLQAKLYRSQYKVLPSIGSNSRAKPRVASKQDEELGSRTNQWPKEQVQLVVQHYMSAADHLTASGSMAETPSFCPCCQDRNNENAIKRTRHQILNPPGSSTRDFPALNSPSSDYGVGMYRSESPDLTVLPQESDTLGDKAHPIYSHLEHPVAHKNLGTAYIGGRDSPDAKLRETAESVLNASSRFQQAMTKLNHTAKHIDK